MGILEMTATTPGKSASPRLLFAVFRDVRPSVCAKQLGDARGFTDEAKKIWESAALGFEPGTLLLRDFGVASAANPKLG